MPEQQSDRLNEVALALVRARMRLARVRCSPPMMVTRLDAVIAEVEALKSRALRS